MMIITGTKANGTKFRKEIEKNAQELDLSDNQLSAIDLTPLGQCQNLRALDLSHNQLSSVDLSPLGQCKNLERLSLWHNQLSKINLYPLGQCTKLRELSLWENPLSKIDLIPLGQCTELQNLNLDKGHINSLVQWTAIKKGEKPEKPIIPSARNLFLLKGFSKVTMDEIAEKAQIAKETIFHHFASKNELALAVLKKFLSLSPPEFIHEYQPENDAELSACLEIYQEMHKGFFDLYLQVISNRKSKGYYLLFRYYIFCERRRLKETVELSREFFIKRGVSNLVWNAEEAERMAKIIIYGHHKNIDDIPIDRLDEDIINKKGLVGEHGMNMITGHTPQEAVVELAHWLKEYGLTKEQARSSSFIKERKRINEEIAKLKEMKQKYPDIQGLDKEIEKLNKELETL
ncbi:MAG: TetR family transcriptional regulator [Candidatus Heimdallarchaeota archaeon]|nr:TetR family transcriptional regulator [Candidatus Heimdallarchaeota archaeon]